MANVRLALAVEVMPGNESAPLHSMPGIWAWLDALPEAQRPALMRGDIAYGSETVLCETEARAQPYLTKLRLTMIPTALALRGEGENVKSLVKKLFRSNHWEEAGQGWEGLEDTLTLSGWSRARRVVVLRRKLTGELLITGKDEDQGALAFIESDIPTAIQAALTNLAAFLSVLKTTAEQLTDTQRLRAILARAFEKFMLVTAGPPLLLATETAG